MEIPGEIEIPEIVPVMTLRDTVFFPHAIMPLFIFEERYRLMLTDILKSHRLFAIFNESCANQDMDYEEPLAPMGTVGIVRASHENPDGTSNLALQGLTRVKLIEITRENPYRMIRVTPCSAQDAVEAHEHSSEGRRKILNLLAKQPELTHGLPEEYVRFLYSLKQPESFIDVAIHSICQNPAVKQKLLETLSLSKRYEVFIRFLLNEKTRLDLFSELQGKTRDNEIQQN